MLKLRAVSAVAIALTGLAACGDGDRISTSADTSSTTAPATTGPEDVHGSLEGPPPVTVRSPSTTLELSPWTFCYINGCADGMPPSDLPDVGTADELTVEFPLRAWTFSAMFRPAGVDCPREQQVPLTPIGDGSFTLSPAGPAGTYDVTLMGAGDGDLFVSFLWTTSQDGPLPDPEARLALIAYHDGQPDSYGIELALSNLASTPDAATATITVTATGGASLQFSATRAPWCFAEGTVYWDGPDEQGLAAAQLGEPPFTYDVEVTLDGVLHRATATWPDDQIHGNEPSVALAFTPALPSL